MRYRTVMSVLPDEPGTPQDALERDRLERLSQAYKAVFLGAPTKEDQELVMTDLANVTGFFRSAHPANDDLAFENGKRAVFERLFQMVELPDDEIAAVATADVVEG